MRNEMEVGHLTATTRSGVMHMEGADAYGSESCDICSTFKPSPTP